MTNKPTELVPTQADRDVAVALMRKIGDRSEYITEIEDGCYDENFFVQAFAAHRLASTAPASEDEVERVARALFECERERSERADAIISAAAGKTVSVDMEPWEKCWQVFHDDARAALAALRPRSEREEVGRRVAKRGGDYEFDGEIVGVIRKRSGAIRYAVEDDRGLLLIMNAKQVGIDERGDFKEPSE